MPKRPTLPALKKKAQILFNKMIRKRDENEPCISCGKPILEGDMDAGHYFPTKGFDALRFDPDNVHGEHSGCNRFDESHLIGYTHNLPERIGDERYDALCLRAHQYKQGTLESPYYFNGKWNRNALEELVTELKHYA